MKQIWGSIMIDEKKQTVSAVNVAERRLFERFDANFPTKYKYKEGDFGDNVFLQNASAQGVRLSSKERLFVNESVSLEVELPDGQNPMVLTGQVVWSKRDIDENWNVGLRFHNLSLMKMSRMFRMNN